MQKRTQILEDGRFLPKKPKNERLKEKEEKELRGRKKERLLNEFEMVGFLAQKGLRNLARGKMLQDRGALPKEEGDIVREYKAMYEENFLSSWLKEVGADKTERTIEVDKETKEEVSEKMISDEEKEENETVSFKRRCVNSVSTEDFDIL